VTRRDIVLVAVNAITKLIVMHLVSNVDYLSAAIQCCLPALLHTLLILVVAMCVSYVTA
jgi:hypothetical protein